MSQVILPGGTIGILGAGQLGRMMTTAAKHMGYRVAVVGASPDDPAAQVADHFIEGDLMSPESAARLARVAGAITVEFENVSVPGLEAAACRGPGADRRRRWSGSPSTAWRKSRRWRPWAFPSPRSGR